MDALITGIVLRRDSGLPAYRQLVDQFRFLIQTGRFREGEFLPPMRVIAAEVGLNLNTVNRAYQQLQRDGLIRSTPGKGAVVTRPAGDGAGSRSASDQSSYSVAPGDVRSILTAAVERALAAGLDGVQVSRQIDEILGECEERSPTRKRVAILVRQDFRSAPLVAALQRVSGPDIAIRAVSSAGDPGNVDLCVQPVYGVAQHDSESLPGLESIDIQVLADRSSIELLLGLDRGSRLVTVAADREVASWLVNLSSTLADPATIRVIESDNGESLEIDDDEIAVIEASHPATANCGTRCVSVWPAFGDVAAEVIRAALVSAP